MTGPVLRAPGSPGVRRLNTAVGLAGLAAFGLLYAAQPVLPQIGEDLGAGPSAASLAVSASTGALALTVLPVAAVAVRVGRAPVLLGSTLVMGAGLALTLPDRLWLVVVGLVVLTAGFFAAHATASGWAPVVAAPHVAHRHSGDREHRQGQGPGAGRHGQAGGA
ncbi:MAG: ynfM, partial [Marmoricola sp.]|nr:ynfM [Marmoricola sp.]